MEFKESRRVELIALLKGHYALIGILVGSALLSVSLGPYSNWDSQTEFAAASGVVKWGLPYTTFGEMINVQAFGFYVDAVFFKVFGLSYQTGVSVITLFGVGCVFLMYKVGELLYGARTGLVAAAFFGLSPWQVIMSRVFLADVQCLFFSLLYLLVGVWAIRKVSLKLFCVSGLLFGLALLTKLYAVFMLIPLLLIYVYYIPKNRKRNAKEIGLFVLSAFILQYLWYDPISGRGLLSVFGHDDFTHALPTGFVPSPFFSLAFITGVLGGFLISACFLSLLLSLNQRRLFGKVLVFDLVSFATVVSVVGLDMYLVLGGNMLVPYVNSIKYDYFALPFFCLLTASLAKKCFTLSTQKSINGKYGMLIFFVVLLSTYLLMVSMVVNVMTLGTMARQGRLIFEASGEFGYALDKLPPTLGLGYVWAIQLSAFMLMQFSLLWANRDKLKAALASL
jgi:4-amino-4-deoxy-L-arabinose transferase-like glycosyltransferase